MDVVAMILRVWALYGRSRLALGGLFTLYTTEGIAYLIYCVKVSMQNWPTGM